MKLPVRLKFGRKKSFKPTARSVAAGLVQEQADQALAQTRELVGAMARGELVIEPREGDADYVGMVRSHRERFLSKMSEDLLLIELTERMERAAILNGLAETYPDLMAEAMSGLRAGAAGKDGGGDAK